MAILVCSHENAAAATVALITKTATQTRAEQKSSTRPEIAAEGLVDILRRCAVLKDSLVAKLLALFDQIDVKATGWAARYGVGLLRVSLGVIFFWFGALKFFPGLSPAQDLAIRTTSILTFGLVPPNISIVVLATWECVIGLGLIFGLFMRATLSLLFMQMLGTLTPILFFPHEIFTHISYAPTLEGQYIIKNLVLISAGVVIMATIRGGGIVSEPKIASRESEKENGEGVRRFPHLVAPATWSAAERLVPFGH